MEDKNEIFERDRFEQANVFGKGEANVNFAQYFIGESFLNPLTDPGQCPLMISNVTFEPDADNQLAYPITLANGRRTDPLCTAGEAGTRKKERIRSAWSRAASSIFRRV